MNKKGYRGLALSLLGGVICGFICMLIIFGLADSVYGAAFGFWGIILFPAFAAFGMLASGILYYLISLKDESKAVKIYFSVSIILPFLFILFLSYPFLQGFFEDCFRPIP